MSNSRSTASSSNPLLVSVGIVGAVVVACGLLLAFVHLASEGDRSATSDESVPSGFSQTRPISVTGASLPLYDAAVQRSNRTDPARGDAPPQISWRSFDGRPVTVAPTGRPRALAFVAHWCPHCRREIPRFASYVATHGIPGGVAVTLVATGTSPSRAHYPPSAWLAAVGPKAVPVLADDSGSRALQSMGGVSLPYWVFVDTNGRVAGRWSGEFPNDGAYARIFAALQAGEPVTPAVVSGA